MTADASGTAPSAARSWAPRSWALRSAGCGGKEDSSVSPYPLTSTGASTGNSRPPSPVAWRAGYELVQRRNVASPVDDPTGDRVRRRCALGPLRRPPAWPTSRPLQRSCAWIPTRWPSIGSCSFTSRRFPALTWEGSRGRHGPLDRERRRPQRSLQDRSDLRRDPANDVVAHPPRAGGSRFRRNEPVALHRAWAAHTRLDPPTGGLLRHFKVGGASSRDYGIAVRPCEVWVGDLLDQRPSDLRPRERRFP